MNEVRVTRKGAERVAGGHPWIFSSDIADRDGAQPGQAVKRRSVCVYCRGRWKTSAAISF